VSGVSLSFLPLRGGYDVLVRVSPTKLPYRPSGGWRRRPLSTPRRLLFQWLERFVVRPGVEFLGTPYGGWPMDVTLIGPGSVCYSAGVGEDASFDRALIDWMGCTVYAFDPTPRVAAYVKREMGRERRFTFRPVGLWSSDTSLMFFAPEVEGGISYSAIDFRHTPAAFEGEVRSVPSLMRELGHDHLDLLKLSVEGAQFEVLDSLLSASVSVDQILVEFTPPVPLHRVRQACRRLRAAGYDLVAIPLQLWSWKFAFIHQQAPRRAVVPAAERFPAVTSSATVLVERRSPVERRSVGDRRRHADESPVGGPGPATERRRSSRRSGTDRRRAA
jgi:FkbM family methyltransferase